MNSGGVMELKENKKNTYLNGDSDTEYKYDIIADGTRRDDRTPKLNVNQIRSLEDRKNVQYINLDSFGHKSVKLITSNLFEISHEKSNKDNSSDYEVEIRTLIDEKGGNSLDIFPEHYQTRVIGYKK